MFETSVGNSFLIATINDREVNLSRLLRTHPVRFSSIFTSVGESFHAHVNRLMSVCLVLTSRFDDTNQVSTFA